MATKKKQCPACRKYCNDDSNFCDIDGSLVLLVDVDDSAFADTIRVDEVPAIAVSRPISKRVPNDANMPAVASQWIKAFLSPMVDLVGGIAKDFTENTFIARSLTARGEFGPHVFRIDFFRNEQWEALLTSRVGEYFLSNYPEIKNDLDLFQDATLEAEGAIDRLTNTLENSTPLVKTLVDLYAQVISHERIARSVYENSTLQQITKLYLGQQALPMSRHPSEATDNLVRFIAYSLLGFMIGIVSSHDDDGRIRIIAKEVAKRLDHVDALVVQHVEQANQAVSIIKLAAPTLHQKLKQELITIAGQYNATIE